MSQGKPVKFELTAEEFDIVNEFCAAVRTGRNKVAKHMLLIGIQNYMAAAEKQKLRQLEAQDGVTVGVPKGHTEQAPVGEAVNTNQGSGQEADRASTPG